MTESYQRLKAGLTALRLDAMHDGLDRAIDRVNDGELSFVDALSLLVQAQVRASETKRTEALIAAAHFPAKKTFGGFDFGFQPELNREEVLDLANLRFMEDGSNVLFVGMPGVGKTHLAIATGMEACRAGKSVCFVTCSALLADLRRAKAENRLDYRLKHYVSFSLLIVDEVGYLPLDTEAGNLIFELVARRYERKSTIITTNKPFGKWGEMFGDPMVANAMLDRLLHHSRVFTIKGPSFRTKDYAAEPPCGPMPSADGIGNRR